MYNIDLSRWNLTIPVDAEIIQTAALQTYASPWFIRNAEGSITFFAPSSGDGISSTENSTYPRSELRETLLNGDDREANWSLGSAPLHRLSATLRVDSLAASGKAIIGQFHGEGSKVPVKVQVTRISGTDRFKVYLQNKPTLGGTEYKPSFATEIALGEVFGYDLRVTSAGLLSCALTTAAGSETLTAQVDVESYSDDTWYAKAGMYSQEVVGGEGAGQATFFALRMFHGEAPATEQPVDPAAPADPLPESQIMTQDDTLAGTASDDLLDGGAGRDRLSGGSG
ncbi:polysaccharide lyase family 7 protein, partial [Azotobacter vinelandii]|uniref:polysaccharide lyase family 7 protein n=1 Tax=Azotobacter vinelandii TaxID=354 RepID=UPI000913F4B4